MKFILVAMFAGVDAIEQKTAPSALMALYNMLGGPGWSPQTNWTVGDPCVNKWHGVTCDVHGTISELKFAKMGLKGNITAGLEVVVGQTVFRSLETLDW